MSRGEPSGFHDHWGIWQEYAERAEQEQPDELERAYEETANYYRMVIANAAKRLRAENVGHLVATDLEDSLSWSMDPKTCAHPYWNSGLYGDTYCRSCGAVTTDIDAMGG